MKQKYYKDDPAKVAERNLRNGDKRRRAHRAAGVTQSQWTYDFTDDERALWLARVQSEGEPTALPAKPKCARPAKARAAVRRPKPTTAADLIGYVYVAKNDRLHPGKEKRGGSYDPGARVDQANTWDDERGWYLSSWVKVPNWREAEALDHAANAARRIGDTEFFRIT